MNLTKQTRVAVLMGGLSQEREVSLRTGKALAQALKTKGYNVVEIDVDHHVAKVLEEKKIEACIIALHGTYGEDGSIQGLLEYLKIPYAGSGIMGSAIAMDKIMSKRLFVASGVPTPKWLESDAQTNLMQFEAELEKTLGFPCVAKPHSEGSTLGLSRVQSKGEVRAAHEKALKHSTVVLWEAFIEGKEYTISVLENKALPVVEIVPHSGFFDYEAKYTKGKTDYFCPARISNELALELQTTALKAFHAVGAECFGRVDILHAKDGLWVLEVNTIPGMTETSLLPKAARATGLSFEDMAETLLKNARLKIGAVNA